MHCHFVSCVTSPNSRRLNRLPEKNGWRATLRYTSNRATGRVVSEFVAVVVDITDYLFSTSFQYDGYLCVPPYSTTASKPVFCGNPRAISTSRFGVSKTREISTSTKPRPERRPRNAVLVISSPYRPANLRMSCSTISARDKGMVTPDRAISEHRISAADARRQYAFSALRVVILTLDTAFDSSYQRQLTRRPIVSSVSACRRHERSSLRQPVTTANIKHGHC